MAPDKQIPDDILLRDQLRLAGKPLYDYVLVSGKQAGVSDSAILPAGRLIKGNIIANNADGSVTIATSDGATIRTRPGQSSEVTDGVFVQNGRVVERRQACRE